MRRRSKRKRWYYHPLFLLLLFVVLIIFIRSTYSSFQKRSITQEEFEAYQQEYQELELRRQKLQENIDTLNTERGREEEYRERFNVVREGERTIRIIEEDNN